jgi:hypothetical protein
MRYLKSHAAYIYLFGHKKTHNWLVKLGKPSVYIKSVDAFRADQPPWLRKAFFENRASEKDNAIEHLIFLN